MDQEQKTGAGALHLDSRLCHSDYQAPPGFGAFPVPIHHASTVLFENCAQMRAADWFDKSGYTYGLHGTPTTFTLEQRLAELDGGKHCVLAPSGLAAIALVNFALLKSGDDLLLPDNAYGPSRDLGRWLQRDYGIKVRFYDPLIGAGIADLILPNTRLIWAEAPGSVTMEMPDIPAISAAAKARGVPLALDNTWAAGIGFDAFAHGVDLIMYALTKYHSGGSDVLMGAVITRDATLAHRLDAAHMRLGFGVGGDDCYLVLRNLPSLKLRYQAQDASARALGTWLKQRPEIATVLHPALPDCPGHAIWRRDFSAAASLFSVLFAAPYSQAQIERFVDSLRLFKIGFSWGGAHSLCVPYQVAGMRSQPWAGEGQLVRFYVGLEDVRDLIADVEQALARL